VIYDNKQTLQALRHLPALPMQVLDLIKLSQDETQSMQAIARTVAQDPVLSANLLALANRAYAPSQQPLTTLEHALMRVGLKNVRSLALATLINGTYQSRRCPAFDVVRYWHDTIAIASGVYRISSYIGQPNNAHELYVAGLLHSIGLYAMAHHFPDELHTCLQNRNPDAPLSPQLEPYFGLSLYQLSSVLLTQWQLPQSLQTLLMRLATQPLTHVAQEQTQPTSALCLLTCTIVWHHQAFNENNIPVPLTQMMSHDDAKTLARLCQHETDEANNIALSLVA
jgi:HD-like signal output (HDOD) protein